MIYCSNCGSALQDDALFCAECGTKTEKAGSTIPQPNFNTTPPEPAVQAQPPVTNQQQSQAQPPPRATANPGQFQHFLKISLPDLVKKVLFDPLDGTKKVLSEIKEPAKIGLYCILISAVIIPLLIYLRIPAGERRMLSYSGVDFFNIFIKIFFLPVIGAFVITFFSFIIKAINNSQTANFGNEILTGGIVCLGYALFFVLAFFLSFILEGTLTGSSYDYDYGYRRRSGPPIFSYIIIFSTFIYLFVITSNSLSQSFRSSGVKDGVSFYLSPFLIVLSAYLTIRLWIAIFGREMGVGMEDLYDI